VRIVFARVFYKVSTLLFGPFRELYNFPFCGATHSITIDPLLVDFPPSQVAGSARRAFSEAPRYIFRERGFQSATCMITVMAANEDNGLVADDRRCEHVVVESRSPFSVRWSDSLQNSTQPQANSLTKDSSQLIHVLQR
jgi:hypothetical protein